MAIFKFIDWTWENQQNQQKICININKCALSLQERFCIIVVGCLYTESPFPERQNELNDLLQVEQ